MLEKNFLWVFKVLLLLVLLQSCAKVGYYGQKKVIVSERLGLYLYDVEVLSFEAKDNREFIILKGSPYRIVTYKEIADSLSWQLEAKGFRQRCKNYNEFPIFGGPFYKVGLSTDYGLAVIITVKPQKKVDVYAVSIEYIKDRWILFC